jgi:hypothetical protein
MAGAQAKLKGISRAIEAARLETDKFAAWAALSGTGQKA